MSEETIPEIKVLPFWTSVRIWVQFLVKPLLVPLLWGAYVTMWIQPKGMLGAGGAAFQSWISGNQNQGCLSTTFTCRSLPGWVTVFSLDSSKALLYQEMPFVYLKVIRILSVQLAWKYLMSPANHEATNHLGIRAKIHWIPIKHPCEMGGQCEWVK